MQYFKGNHPKQAFATALRLVSKAQGTPFRQRRLSFLMVLFFALPSILMAVGLAYASGLVFSQDNNFVGYDGVDPVLWQLIISIVSDPSAIFVIFALPAFLWWAWGEAAWYQKSNGLRTGWRHPMRIFCVQLGVAVIGLIFFLPNLFFDAVEWVSFLSWICSSYLVMRLSPALVPAELPIKPQWSQAWGQTRNQRWVLLFCAFDIAVLERLLYVVTDAITAAVYPDIFDFDQPYGEWAKPALGYDVGLSVLDTLVAVYLIVVMFDLTQRTYQRSVNQGEAA